MATETYTLGYGPASLSIMSSRTAESHAGFFVSRLRSGMKVLDIGCGPGTITSGIAERVRPGSVVGVDVMIEQTSAVAEEVRRRELDVTFVQAKAYSLPFPANHFDAVFISALLGNLSDPHAALVEARRVTKARGIIGVKEFDEAAHIIYPEVEAQTRLQELYMRLRQYHGHDPRIGRKVRSYLNAAGFNEVRVAAVFEPATRRPGATANGFIETMVRNKWGKQFVDLGWATEEQVEDWLAHSEAYGADQDDFCARAWVEATALKADE